MIKAGLIVALSTTVALAWFSPPRVNLGKSDDSHHIDANYVRIDAKAIVVDSRGKKYFYDGAPSDAVSFDGALAYCADMNHSGYTDWRVPTKEEMRDLLENSRSSVAIKHAFKNVKAALYWSSTETSLNKAWYFDFDLGRYGKREKNKNFHVLCVRDVAQ